MARCISVFFATSLGIACIISPCEADVVVSQNLSPSAYSASGTLAPEFEPQLAFDGVVGESGWNAGDFPVQWLEVDLQQVFELTSFRFYVDQNPDGQTTHEIWISNAPIQGDLSSATKVHTFSGFTAYQDVLVHELTTPMSAQHVQFRTVDSQSWVGWLEVEAFAVPEPPSCLLAVLNILGLSLPGWRRRLSRPQRRPVQRLASRQG